ncbi:alkylation response protein AidB-like acyl-CoA dehydrogenase [Kibdelosporangium banguiense]|uniref:Alkylation response protein AidB-like acyl-CoA dehydrogenase n=1 Tax=Kibdelosporangium banguiense TaxID=1365924 RepID=A0ABS4U0X4_9PSEU|nr:acyl-CoA dehydrogenase family protein [Kibdelosporangium banguiense]MBP2330312.1 alkylation response protein AidB-like acyl-CoA dehydrogenase [Kibdelosporangium banguiense]
MLDSVIQRTTAPGEFESLHHAARESAELARRLAATTEQRRALPVELVDKLAKAQLLRSGVPRHLGGPEAPPAVSLETAEAVARGDASAGWCVSIAVTSSLLSAYAPRQCAEEVFGDPTTVAAGVWAPKGRGRQVDGGVVLSGQWAFCSGIPHADWLFAGFVLDRQLRVAALPKADLEVLDTWHTNGLRGTGSHDCVANELFVPDHRVFSVVDGPPAQATRLHRFPLFGYFALSIAAAALGNARGAIDDLVELAAGRKSLGSSRTLAERSHTQAVVAESEAALRAARLLMYQSIDDAWQADQATDDLKAGIRLAATHVVRTSAKVTAAMYDLGGGATIYQGSPLERRFRDAHTATAHFQVNQASYELPGRLLLGQPAQTGQL